VPIDQRLWQQRLADSIQKYDVPGASVAALHGGEVSTFCAGVLNTGTGVEVTTDSLFQIGSVTKAYTATLVLALADAGLLDLDEPVVRHVPELRLADHGVRERVTLRHLLRHTSGIDGDHFLDLGRGEDVLERYAAGCGSLTQVLPLDAAWSYCNTGYAIAGRAVEKVTGEVFDAAMTSRLLAPLGADRSCLLPEDALRHRVAYGHVPGPDGLHLAPVPVTPRTMAPAGGVMATASDVLRLVRVYLDAGRTATGDRLLAAGTVEEAWQEQVPVPDPSMGSGWGLGWMLAEWAGHRVVGHDGGTVGQAAFVRVFPDDGVAIVLQGNGPGVGELLNAVVGDLAEELCGARPPAPYAPSGSTRGERPDWLGDYVRENMRIRVGADDQGLTVTVEIGGLAADSLGASTFQGRLERSPDGTYITDAVGEWMPLVPFRAADGTACVHFGGRAQARRSSAS
jgi:CubicO group peptidase (beta-lactamase class C family)